ncbi:MAG TPA: hypothetical protein VJA46_12125 [Acidimicrobiia bacterium]|nr:hypothetical protein [Acidimicrobiia bacterium]
MRNELNDLIRAIVDTRFAVTNVANRVIQDLRQGYRTSYRDHTWGKEHYEAMEKVHLGVEAAWHYAKWLQIPEADFRLEEGSAALAGLLDDLEMFFGDRLTSPELSIASPAVIRHTEGAEMASKHTVASLAEWIQDLSDRIDEAVGNLNDQLSELERGLDHAIESAESGQKDGRKKRTMTDEQRKEVGRRLQQARADKLGLQTIEQLHALKLRPGQQPTKAQITKVKKELPVKS